MGRVDGEVIKPVGERLSPAVLEVPMNRPRSVDRLDSLEHLAEGHGIDGPFQFRRPRERIIKIRAVIVPDRVGVRASDAGSGGESGG